MFAVPLLDGRHGLVHIAHVKQLGRTSHAIAAGFFSYTAGSIEDLWQLVQGADLSLPFAVISITQSVISNDEWKLMGERPAKYANVDVPSRIRGSLSLFDGHEMDPDWILDMYHGNYPWDGFHDPRYLDKLLLPGQPRPASARMRADFTPQRLAELRV